MADSNDRRIKCPKCHCLQEIPIYITEFNCIGCGQKCYVAEITQPQPKQPKEGLKYDHGKLRWELFPAESAEQIIKVLMFGATKYDAWNWSKGIKFTRLFAALMRHMWAWYRGETNDPETGLNHLAHAGCCLMFLLSYSQRKDYLEQFDDRPSYYNQQPGWVEIKEDK